MDKSPCLSFVTTKMNIKSYEHLITESILPLIKCDYTRF